MAEVVLTPEQEAVITNRGGTLLTSAAAGSGKTKVLVDRVLRRVADEGKNVNEFLIITFTNAAAAELRGKISSAISEELARQPENRHLSRQLELLELSQISTVHAFCGALIRQYGYLLDIPSDYRMLEEGQRTELLQRLLEELLEEAYAEGNENFRLLTDTLGAGRTDKTLAELILSMHDVLQSQPYPEAWLSGQQLYLEPEAELSETTWGGLLVTEARRRLVWLLSRYDWAISAMEGDELLTPKYLPSYLTQRKQLERILAALDGPWDGFAAALEAEYPRVSVRNYPNPALLEDIKAVRLDGKELLESLKRIMARPSRQLIEEQNQLAPALEALVELVRRLEERFSREKRRKNMLDFSDQEHLAIRLLLHPGSGQPTDAAREVTGRFTEIMVDEYQDSNRVQELIFSAICRPGDTNRFLVGDVKQSIYGFRQAEPGIFLEKYRSYQPGETAGNGQPRKLILSKNFRSRPEILEAVNHVFATVMSEDVGDIAYGAEERLYEGLGSYPNTGRTHVEMHVLEPEKTREREESKYTQEAWWTARRIAAMLRDKTPVRDGDALRPVRPGDIAVLLRTRAGIDAYRRALESAGIPVAADGGENLFETPEVRVLMNLLRVLNNPHQDIPLLAVLCSPLFRFSNDQLAEIRSGSRARRFYDAMEECGAPWCVETVGRLEKLRSAAGQMPADTLVWTLLHETGLLAAYSAMEGGKRRRENLLAVYRLAQKAASDGYLYLYQLLRSLERTAESGSAAASEATGGVVITTIHKSKGLEYPVVILADLSRKFNFRELNEAVLFDGDDGIGAKITDREKRIRYPGLSFEALRVKKQRALRSEELRILYVAMTRARDYLVMTYTSEYALNRLKRLRIGAGQPAAAWMSASAGCPGDWVLLAALSRVESGALFEIAGRPRTEMLVSEYPWEVSVESLEGITAPRGIFAPEAEERGPAEVPAPEELLRRLTWQDGHRRAAEIPSKLTATQLKGRDKDQEVAEGAGVRSRLPQLRRPEFILEKRGLSATERGTAVHLFLQYADFGRCGENGGVSAELTRLLEEEYLTEQQAKAVSPEIVQRLFASPLGKRMLGAARLIREFKFSILVNAADYYPDVDGEQVLLQGVVDAAVEEADGLTVIDFKTDRVTEDSVIRRAEEYRGQLETYRRALERIFGKPVKEMTLYFLSIGKAVTL